LTRLKHFLSDERKKAHAQKRGGGQPLVSLDAESAEQRYLLEPATELTPEMSFDQRWAIGRLGADARATARGALHDDLDNASAVFQGGMALRAR
jgi:hypothetical protein